MKELYSEKNLFSIQYKTSVKNLFESVTAKPADMILELAVLFLQLSANQNAIWEFRAADKGFPALFTGCTHWYCAVIGSYTGSSNFVLGL